MASLTAVKVFHLGLYKCILTLNISEPCSGVVQTKPGGGRGGLSVFGDELGSETREYRREQDCERRVVWGN